MSELDDFDAAEIASAWYFTSMGRVHSEEHRENLIAYIETCLIQAAKLDENLDDNPPMLPDYFSSNVEELEALREWARDYQIGKEG